MRIARAGSIIGVIVLLGGCHHGKKPAAVAPPPMPMGVVTADARIYYDNSGGIQDSVRQVIRDARTLQTVWQQATANQPSPPPVPNVDFAHQMVLVVGAGRMTPEDQIHVDSVGVQRELTAAGTTREMLAVIVRVTEGCRRFNRDAYPVEMVRVQKYDGAVRFIERRGRAENCGSQPPVPAPASPGPVRGARGR